jgi:hypothetical protein
MPYNMMIGHDIYDCFYNGTFSIASMNDRDVQNLLLATVLYYFFLTHLVEIFLF